MNNCNDNEVIIGMAPVSHGYPVNDYELPEGEVVIMDDDLCPHLVDWHELTPTSTPKDIKDALAVLGHVGIQASLDILTLSDTYIKSHVQPQPEQWRGQGKRRMKRVK